MLKDSVAVFDISSSKVTGLIGENGVNKNFIIRAIADVAHEAVYEGKVEDARGLSSALLSAFSSVSETAKAKIDEVFVSVPGEFVLTRNKQQRVYYNRRRRMKKRDVEDFLNEAQKSMHEEGYEIIDRRGVMYYVDGERRVESLLNETTASVNGYVTFFYSPVSFVRTVKQAFASLGVKKVRFIPSPLAEGLFLFSREERFSYAILVDCGYLSTSISVLYGGGVLYHASFPLGGGHITAYLYDRLNVDFELAERIKRKLNLSVPREHEGTYEVNWGENTLSFPQRDCNDVARSIIGNVAEQIDSHLAKSRVRLPHNVAVSLTGGGISYTRGAKEFLSSRIEMPVNVVYPPVAYMSKPDDSSKLAALNYALNVI